jgi:acyl-CoA synthetase (AMP-forming)/AMP-acid ligase II
VVPCHHSHGFHNSVIFPLLNGATLILMAQFTPAGFVKLAAAERANTLIGSPFLYRMLLEHGVDLPTLSLCVSAGARLPQALGEDWRRRFGTRIRQLYGSTETSVISIGRADDAAPEGTVGTPIDEVEIRVLDGEIAVRSPMVMAGYIGEPELNAPVFADGFYRTGDAGCIDEEGRVRLLGRLRRRINLAGVKVDPVEIEMAVESLAGVAACHADSGDGESELIRVRIERRAGAGLTRAEVIAHCRTRLAEYKLPRVIEFVDALPVTLAGKIPARRNKVS